MNVILLISDTVRYDYLGCCGNDWVRTPHLDALAARSMVFDRFYVGSFPTGPMRKDVHSGRFTFPYANWTAERPADEPALAELLSAAGYRTAYIGDTDNSQQYLAGFEHSEIVSHEPSNMADVPEEVPLPAEGRKLRFPRKYAMRIARWSHGWRDEADRRAPRTMLAAHRWLESTDASGDRRPFFLWVDTFDPHEPWDPPQYYVDLYDPGYSGNVLMEPAYQPAGYATEREIRHMRCRYAAKLTMVDRWIGFLLEGLARMPMADDTAILFTSDHGFYHGEHGLIGKVGLDRDNVIVGRWPLYDTMAHAPLLMAPARGGAGGRRSNAFCQGPDLTATILDLCGADRPGRMHRRSLVPIVNGRAESVRDLAVSSTTYVQDAEVRSPTSVRTDKWLYIYGGDEWPSELYDLEADPAESRNVIDEHAGAARQMHDRYIAFLESVECPKSSLEARREFRPAPRDGLPRKRLI